ncbi:DUF2147 domain-containing protein [Rhodopila globiformis]|nr:DUF2147 domain-containing protein [Rhodopila globiformis]
MLRLLAFLVVLLLLPLPAAAVVPPMAGLWLTQDHDGVIGVEPCGDKLCARIAGFFLDHPADPTPLDYRGVSQCHLPLISDAGQVAPNLWKGHITDPRNGSVYHVELWLTPEGALALRGYLGIPLFGQTQTWTRYAGTVPADCRLTPPAGHPEVVRPGGGAAAG